MQRRKFASEESVSQFRSEHMSLDQIFTSGGREFLFTSAHRNVRSFVWTKDQAGDLLDSILDLDGDGENALQLSQITLVRKNLDPIEQKRIGSTSKLFHIYDGQQRIATLSLLFAALRDKFMQFSDSQDVAEQAASFVCPDKPRLQRVNRITLRESKVMDKILSNRTKKVGLAKKDNEPSPLQLPSISERKRLSQSDQLVLEVYEHFVSRLDHMDLEEAISLHEKIQRQCFLIIQIPTDHRIAIRLVIGQSKGIDLQAVDFIKLAVCFGCEDQVKGDETAAQWSKLADETSNETLLSACLLVAQASLGKVMTKHGEVDIMYDFLKSRGSDGRACFDKDILPATKLLHDFRQARLPSPKGQAGSEAPSFKFLRAASSITTAKEMEMVILHFLLKHGTETEEACCIFRQLEVTALWMIFTKPHIKIRRAKCFELIQNSTADPSLLQKSLVVPGAECQAIIDGLRNFSCAPSNGPTIARAILDRLNEESLLHEHQGRMVEESGSLQLEHVLPVKYGSVPEWRLHWQDPKIASRWQSRLGNLALLNQKVNAQISNGPFESKRERFSRSPYPLTRRIGEYSCWDPSAVQQSNEELVKTAIRVWNLQL